MTPFLLTALAVVALIAFGLGVFVGLRLSCTALYRQTKGWRALLKSVEPLGSRQARHPWPDITEGMRRKGGVNHGPFGPRPQCPPMPMNPVSKTECEK